MLGRGWRGWHHHPQKDVDKTLLLASAHLSIELRLLKGYGHHVEEALGVVPEQCLQIGE